jgi:hypothetical protein
MHADPVQRAASASGDAELARRLTAERARDVQRIGSEDAVKGSIEFGRR